VLGRLLEIIVLLLVVRAVWRTLSSIITVSGGVRRTTASRGEARGPRAVKLERDPVCGTYVSPDSAIYEAGNYFCSEKCRDDYMRRAS
jgi:hypothetical protein